MKIHFYHTKTCLKPVAVIDSNPSRFYFEFLNSYELPCAGVTRNVKERLIWTCNPDLGRLTDAWRSAIGYFLSPLVKIWVSERNSNITSYFWCLQIFLFYFLILCFLFYLSRLHFLLLYCLYCFYFTSSLFLEAPSLKDGTSEWNI